MVNDPQANDLLRLRLLRGYGLAYLNGTEGDGLYIQGGEYYTKDDFNGVPSTINWARDEGWEPNDRLFKLSLEKPWTSAATFNNLLPRVTVYNNPKTGAGAPASFGGVLSLPQTSGIGTGYGSFVSVGGLINKTEGTRGDVWTFTGEAGRDSAGAKSNSRFSAVDVKNAEDFKIEFGGSTVDGEGKVWWLGGSSAGGKHRGRLLWFDPKSGDSGVYIGSGEGTVAPTGSGWYRPSLVWVPVGDKGILVAMGGTLHKGTTVQPARMDRVSVFDIATAKWYTQAAVPNPNAASSSSKASSGATIPSVRSHFCAATPLRVGSLPETTNWEIFFYGGRNHNDSIEGKPVGIDDFWALSIPSFTWTRLWAGNNSYGKWGRPCTIMNDVFYGFVDVARTDEKFNKSAHPLLSFFDVTGTNWVRYWSPGNSKRGYATPLLVQSGVDETGNKPPDGFTEGLEEVFANTKEAPKSPAKKSDNAGAIAGGVIGGLALLSFIALGFWLWRRRRQRREPPVLPTATTATTELDGSPVAPVEVHAVPISTSPGSYGYGNERYTKLPLADEQNGDVPRVELPANEPIGGNNIGGTVAELPGSTADESPSLRSERR